VVAPVALTATGCRTGPVTAALCLAIAGPSAKEQNAAGSRAVRVRSPVRRLVGGAGGTGR
jgi:hypothetical protein